MAVRRNHPIPQRATPGSVFAATPKHSMDRRPYERQVHKYPFNLGLFKGTHVSVGITPNSKMPSITEQLDAGVTCVEIGIFSEVSGANQPDWRVGVFSPETTDQQALSLRHWLGVINNWTQSTHFRMPLVIILDIKDELVNAPSFGGGAMLVRIGNLIKEFFGTRTFWFPELVKGKWPTVQQLIGRVIPVITGSARAKQYYLGTGQEPAVAGNKNGTVVQVCNKADQVCYFSGKYNQDGSIDWQHTGSVGTGKNPAVAINDEGHVITVFEYIAESKLMYAVGKVLANGDIAWNEPKHYDKGVTPSIAMQAAGKHFIEVHKSQNKDNLWYHVGKIDSLENSNSNNSNNANSNNGNPEMFAIDFGPSKKYPKEDSGKDPSVRFSTTKANRVESIHLSVKTGKAWLWDGDLNPDGTIEWDMKTHAQVAEQPFKNKCTVPANICVENKQDILYWNTGKTGIVKPKQQFFVELSLEEVTTWPEELKLECSFVSVKVGTDPSAVVKFKSDGKVVRMINCNDQGWVPQDVTAVANIIATDLPEGKYHQTYLEVLNNLAKAQ